jgi:hypothetical protein
MDGGGESHPWRKNRDVPKMGHGSRWVVESSKAGLGCRNFDEQTFKNPDEALISD